MEKFTDVILYLSSKNLISKNSSQEKGFCLFHVRRLLPLEVFEPKRAQCICSALMEMELVHLDRIKEEKLVYAKV